MPYYKTVVEEDDLFLPDPEWSPTYWTAMKNRTTLGNDIADFIEAFITPPRLNTENWEVLAWQRWLLCHMFEINSFGLLRYKKIYWQIAKKNGKSFLASAILLYFLFKGKDGDQLYCAAASSKQARLVFDEVGKNIGNSPALKRFLKPLENSISSKIVSASLKPLSSNAGTGDGISGYITVGDEMHRWDGISGNSKRGRDLNAVITKGSKDRDESVFLMITTAGSNFNGIAYENYTIAKRVASGELEDDSFGVFIWEAEESDDIYEPSTWRKANPNLTAGLMREEDFLTELKEGEVIGTSDFERFSLNKWLQFNDKEQFINPVYFEKAYRDIKNIPIGSDIVVGFDGSFTEDATVCVGLDLTTGLILPLWLKEKQANQQDFFVEEDEVKEAMDWIFDNWNVRKLYADQSRYQGVVAGWRRKYGKGIVRDIPQSNIRRQPIAADFKQDLYSGAIVHNNDPALRRHFLNAVENMYHVPRKESEKSKNKIDILMAAIFANGARREILDREDRQRSQNQQAGLPF